jgi:hypothetical protein
MTLGTSTPLETPVCVFCSGSPTEVEDVWPKWIQRLFPKTSALAITGNPGTGHSGVYRTMAFDARAKVVCKKCNNNWMSDIENRASVYIKRMLFQNFSIALGPQSQTKLAAWGLLKALLLPYIGPDSNPAIPEHYGEFGQRKLPWARHTIFIARHDGSMLPGFQTYLIDISHKEDRKTFPDAKAYGITFHIDKLVLQVFGHNLSYWVQIPYPREFTPFVIQIWPPYGGTMHWPPSYTMSARNLQDFRHTFHQIGK